MGKAKRKQSMDQLMDFAAGFSDIDLDKKSAKAIGVSRKEFRAMAYGVMVGTVTGYAVAKHDPDPEIVPDVLAHAAAGYPEARDMFDPIGVLSLEEYDG